MTKKCLQRCAPSSLILATALLAMWPSRSSALVVTQTNSLASYSYDSTNAFVPADPVTSAAAPLSTFSFLPTTFVASTSGTGTNTTTAVVSLDMMANPGFWFDGAAIFLSLNAETTYSLAAPSPTSSAQVSLSAPVSVDVTGLDGAPYVSGTPLPGTLTVTPSSVSVSGPLAFTNGSLSGTFTLDINTIKVYFGIGAGSKITAMRLQISPILTAQSQNGSATGQLVNFDVANNVVPEPSTYALLLIGAGALGFVSWRRRRA